MIKIDRDITRDNLNIILDDNKNYAWFFEISCTQDFKVDEYEIHIYKNFIDNLNLIAIYEININERIKNYKDYFPFDWVGLESLGSIVSSDFSLIKNIFWDIIRFKNLKLFT